MALLSIEPSVFLRIEDGRAIMSNGYKYTIPNLEMTIKNIKAHSTHRIKEIPEFEKALEAMKKYN